ncbi:hypothetical protein Vi05172_g9738 [Venturia inaequalis]|nr:hypothetical protein Vi05172_g9738 [Venturia inaequalis]
MCYEYAQKYTSCGCIWPLNQNDRLIGFCGRALARHAECGTHKLDHRLLPGRCQNCLPDKNEEGARTSEESAVGGKETWRHRADSLEVTEERPRASRSWTLR